MEKIVYGNISAQGIEVVLREERYFVRYDAGDHVVAWREDEITAQEFSLLSKDKAGEREAIFQVQRRLEQAGIDPYKQNWSPVGLAQ